VEKVGSKIKARAPPCLLGFRHEARRLCIGSRPAVANPLPLAWPDLSPLRHHPVAGLRVIWQQHSSSSVLPLHTGLGIRAGRLCAVTVFTSKDRRR